MEEVIAIVKLRDESQCQGQFQQVKWSDAKNPKTVRPKASEAQGKRQPVLVEKKRKIKVLFLFYFNFK